MTLSLRRLLALTPLLAALVPFAGAQPAPEAPPETTLQIINISAAGPLPPATITTVTDFAQLPDDFWTHGTYHDTLLSNSLAGFVFGAIAPAGEEPNIHRQGNLLDVFASPASTEAVQLIAPVTRLDSRTILVTEIEPAPTSNEGAAALRALGRDTVLTDLLVDTRYELQRDHPGLLATTTVTNSGAAPITVPVLGDYVLTGGYRLFVPGYGVISQVRDMDKVEFLLASFLYSNLLIAPQQGRFDIAAVPGAIVLAHARNVRLEPGQSRSFSRWILVADFDPGTPFSHVLEQRGREAFGYIAGQVNERLRLPDGTVQDSRPIPGAEVRVSFVSRSDVPQNFFGRPYVMTRTDRNGRYQLALPPGEYTVAAAAPARLFEPSNLAIRVRPSQVSAVDHAVSRASGVAFEIIEAGTGRALPGKLSFLPLRGSNQPDFGPPGALASSNTVYTHTGKGFIEVPSGNYRVVASHGNEYHMAEQRLRVDNLDTKTLRFELRRAFEPKGWISADLGVLTNASSHSRITPEDRVVTAVAEGIQWLVTADTNGRPTDLNAAAASLGLADRLRTTGGLRFIGDANRAVGDFTLIPADACATANFAAARAAKSPTELVSILRALCPSSLLLANRPIFPTQGALTILGYDPNTGVLPPNAPALDVDGFQILEGKRQALFDQSLEAYFQLLANGVRTTPFANSMSAGSFNEEPGYPRIYLPSADRDPARLDIPALMRAFREGRVQITNGPFIDLSVNGQPMGSIVTDTDGFVDVDLKVFAPNWANVSSITINLNGRFVRKFLLPAGSVDAEAGQIYPTPRTPEDGRFRLNVPEDSILHVLVEGDPALNQDPVNPSLFPTNDPSVPQGQRTMALSAPILIDANGDGRVTPKLERVGNKQPAEFVAPF